MLARVLRESCACFRWHTFLCMCSRGKQGNQQLVGLPQTGGLPLGFPSNHQKGAPSKKDAPILRHTQMFGTSPPACFRALPRYLRAHGLKYVPVFEGQTFLVCLKKNAEGQPQFWCGWVCLFSFPLGDFDCWLGVLGGFPFILCKKQGFTSPKPIQTTN